jgi:hypothetical protein
MRGAVVLLAALCVMKVSRITFKSLHWSLPEIGDCVPHVTPKVVRRIMLYTLKFFNQFELSH